MPTARPRKTFSSVRQISDRLSASSGLGKHRPKDLDKNGLSDIVSLTPTGQGFLANVRFSATGAGNGNRGSVLVKGKYVGLGGLGARKGSGFVVVTETKKRKNKPQQFQWGISRAKISRNKLKLRSSRIGTFGQVGLDTPLFCNYQEKAVPATYRNGILSLQLSKKQIRRLNVGGTPSCVDTDEPSSLIVSVNEDQTLTIQDINGNVRYSGIIPSGLSLSALRPTSLLSSNGHTPTLIAFDNPNNLGTNLKLLLLGSEIEEMDLPSFVQPPLAAHSGIFGNYRGVVFVRSTSDMTAVAVIPDYDLDSTVVNVP